MSGLYNMVMGKNPIFGHLCYAVGINQEWVQENPLGRIRDAWISEDAKTICILHRNYGEDGKEFNANAEKLPTFVAHHVDEDETYGWWEFTIPEDGDPEMYPWLKMAAEKTDNRNCMVRYREIIDKMGKEEHQDEPDVKRAMEAGKKIIHGIGYAQEEGIADVSHEGGTVTVTAHVPDELIDEEKDVN